MRINVLGTVYTVIEANATEDEMADWIAIRFPKMLKVFEEAECV